MLKASAPHTPITNRFVRQCLEAEVAEGAGAWADPSDYQQRSLSIAGLGTTAKTALHSAMLFDALTTQHLEVSERAAFTSVDSALRCEAWNLALVLSPYKTEVASRVHRLSPAARATGVVDTLLRVGDEIFALNTNSWAVGAVLDALISNVSPPRVLLLGSGGSARSVALALTRRWPDNEVLVSARRADAVEELSSRFAVRYVSPDEVDQLDPTVIINSTTWGETPESEAQPFMFSPNRILRPGCLLFDLNNRRSALQEQALANGCAVMSGTLMQRVTNACRAAAVRYILDGGPQ